MHETDLSLSRPQDRIAPARSVARKAIRSFAWISRSKLTIGAIAAIYNEDGRILVIKNRLYERGAWGLPAGLSKLNEPTDVTATREVEEEVGLQLPITPDHEVALYRQPWSRHIDVLYRIEKVKEGVLKPGRFEIKDARWVDPDRPGTLTPEASLALEVLRGFRPSGTLLFWRRTP